MDTQFLSENYLSQESAAESFGALFTLLKDISLFLEITFVNGPVKEPQNFCGGDSRA